MQSMIVGEISQVDEKHVFHGQKGDDLGREEWCERGRDYSRSTGTLRHRDGQCRGTKYRASGDARK